MKPPQVALAVLLVAATQLVSVARGQTSQPGGDEARWFKNVRQVTKTEMGLARSGEAYFAPDSKRICFQAFPAGKEDYQIYVMNLDGTGLKMISTGVGACTCSFFHPSGEKVIFASNHDDLRPPMKPEELEAKRPRGEAGAGGGQSGHPGGHPSAEAGHPGGHRGGAAQDHPGEAQSQPAGHPGGKPGEGGARHGGGGGGGYAWKYYPGMELYEYTFATGALKRLTNSDGYDAECAYSPDGKQIVFCSFREGTPAIWICDADGQNARRVTHDIGRNGGPFFSPDGKRVLYRSDRDGSGNLQIFVNNVAGTDEKALTDNASFHWCPFWHPSGKWIIFTHADFRKGKDVRFDLYIMRDDGSDVQRVTTEGEFNGLPVFSPDGRYLMWTSKRGGIDSPQVFVADFVGLTAEGELRGK